MTMRSILFRIVGFYKWDFGNRDTEVHTGIHPGLRSDPGLAGVRPGLLESRLSRWHRVYKDCI